MIPHSRHRARALLVAMLISLACTVKAQVTILGVQYQQDNPYTQFQCIWHDAKYPTSCGSVVTGANVHVYFKNTGSSSVTISDVTLAGYGLTAAIPTSTSIGPSGGGYLSSIYFHWSSPPQDILNAGEPVWFKVDPGDTVPTTLPVGGLAQAVVRLRHVPTTGTVAVGVVTSAGTVTTNITIDFSAPQLAGIGYSADLTQVYLNWRRSGGAAPASIWMDGVNVTAQATTVGDPNVDFGVSVLSLNSALTAMSYHVFQGVYADGKVASASQRAWANKFIIAAYGNFNLTGSYTAANWVAEATDHGVNNCQDNMGMGMGTYLGSNSGATDAQSKGYGYTIDTIANLNKLWPDMWFLYDGPPGAAADSRPWRTISQLFGSLRRCSQVARRSTGPRPPRQQSL